jgi:hypothetical protein
MVVIEKLNFELVQEEAKEDNNRNDNDEADVNF